MGWPFSATVLKTAMDDPSGLPYSTAGSAIALTGAVRMLVLSHEVTADASLYINRNT